MVTPAKRLFVTILATLAMLAGIAPPAHGQIRIKPGPIGSSGSFINPNWLVAPGLNINQALYNTAAVAQAYSYIPPYLLGYNPYALNTGYGVSPYATGYAPSLSYNPYAGGYANPYASLYSSPATAYGGSTTTYPTGGYGTGGASPYSYASDPTYGFLRGASDVVNSQGKLVMDLEQAKLAREKARQGQIDTRRKLFDEILYERSHTLSFTERREQAIAQNLRRSQGSAPITEIWSAKALNDLLADLKKLHGKKVYGPEIRLDADVLKQINVQGNSPGNIGLLRNEGRLNWPLGLRDLRPAADSRELRMTLEARAILAVSKASKDRLHPGDIRELQDTVNKLHRLLARNVTQLPANQYITAKQFLNNFDDAIRALQDPKASSYFNKTYVAQGETVRQLVDHMMTRGLTFAATTPGDETAYQALHSALAAYDVAAHQEASTAKR
jgi:hypothetical protein